MPALDLTARLTTGDRALPQGWQTMVFFLQEGSGAHYVRVIQVYLLLAIGKQHVNVPAPREMGEQGWGVGLQSAASPESGLREQSHTLLTDKDNLIAIEFPQREGDHMRDRGTGAQPDEVAAELVPTPALGICLISDPPPVMALESGSDEKVTGRSTITLV